MYLFETGGELKHVIKNIDKNETIIDNIQELYLFDQVIDILEETTIDEVLKNNYYTEGEYLINNTDKVYHIKKTHKVIKGYIYNSIKPNVEIIKVWYTY